MLGILCTSYFGPDKSGRQVSLYSVSLNLAAIFEPDRSSIPRPQIPGQVDSYDRAGGNNYNSFWRS
jgi:hypothetical protein